MRRARCLVFAVAMTSFGACGSADDEPGAGCEPACGDGQVCVDGTCVTEGDPPPSSSEVECTIDASPPDSLMDTCFSRIQGGRLAPNLRSYQPVFEQHTGGADLRRWVYLPPGTQVDVSSLDDWQFPSGTIVWQEHTSGVRVETRMLEKNGSGSGTGAWRATLYLWQSDQADAIRSPDGTTPETGAEFSIDALPEYVRASEEACAGCHQGAADALLGFSALQLSDASLQGNIEVWADSGYLSEAVDPVVMIGDALDRTVLGYLHTNCGSCHTATGVESASGLDLRYDVDTTTDLATTNLWQTALYQQRRIVPANPTMSTVYTSIADGTMPGPDVIGAVDDEFLQHLRVWLNKIEPLTGIETTLPMTISADNVNGIDWLGWDATQAEGGEGQVFAVNGKYMLIRSKVYVPVSTSASYRISGRFRSNRATTSRIYLGVACYDENKEFIGPVRIQRSSTDSLVDVGATTAGTLATVEAPTGWYQAGSQGYRRGIGFYYDGDTAKLPDFVLENQYDRELTDATSGAYSDATSSSIPLNIQIPSSVLSSLTANTVVRNHRDGGSSYNYTAANGVLVPQASWTAYTGDITGEQMDVTSPNVFRMGTRYVRLLILANYSQDGQDVELLFDDLSIVQLPPS